MSAAPPVKDRPKCPGCSEPLAPRMAHTWPIPKDDATPKSREWLGTYKSYGAFCTLRCCEAYANEMFKRHGSYFVVVKAARIPA